MPMVNALRVITTRASKTHDGQRHGLLGGVGGSNHRGINRVVDLLSIIEAFSRLIEIDMPRSLSQNSSAL
jgi:hypothetical protein